MAYHKAKQLEFAFKPQNFTYFQILTVQYIYTKEMLNLRRFEIMKLNEVNHNYSHFCEKVKK